MRLPLGRVLVPALTAGVLAVGTLSAPSSATDDPDPTPVGASTPEAAAALEQVEEILDGDTTAATETTGPDLTMALRDLRLHMDDLSARDRTAARALVSRPVADTYQDFPLATGSLDGVRVHWRSADSGVSDAWVQTVGGVITHVLSVYKSAGYRAPKSDGTAGGGSNLLDIYLVDFAAEGSAGLYGFCDASQTPPSGGPYDVAAFCAFDHNFAGFPRTPEANLKVTAAHELFHAVQFAYDYNEDPWFMEATATWAEDELYDSINDNRQYLAQSPLRQPRQPLDQFGDSLRQYGEWIFFRYLTERFPKSQGGLPVIIRRLWTRVDSTNGRARDGYSIQAVARELRSQGTDLRRFYAQFGDANRRPRKSYEEGSAYKPSPAVKRWAMGGRRTDTRWQSFRLDHLATSTIAVTPATRNRRLRVDLDLPNLSRGSAAVVTTYSSTGRASRRTVSLSKTGNGALSTTLDTRKVSRIDITLANAGTRYECWVGRVDGVYYSCYGDPRNDDQVMRYRLRVIR